MEARDRRGLELVELLEASRTASVTQTRARSLPRAPKVSSQNELDSSWINEAPWVSSHSTSFLPTLHLISSQADSRPEEEETTTLALASRPRKALEAAILEEPRTRMVRSLGVKERRSDADPEGMGKEERDDWVEVEAMVRGEGGGGRADKKVGTKDRIV